MVMRHVFVLGIAIGHVDLDKAVEWIGKEGCELKVAFFCEDGDEE
jgi:hypothetical protein